MEHDSGQNGFIIYLTEILLTRENEIFEDKFEVASLFLKANGAKILMNFWIRASYLSENSAFTTIQILAEKSELKDALKQAGIKLIEKIQLSGLTIDQLSFEVKVIFSSGRSQLIPSIYYGNILPAISRELKMQEEKNSHNEQTQSG